MYGTILTTMELFGNFLLEVNQKIVMIYIGFYNVLIQMVSFGLSGVIFQLINYKMEEPMNSHQKCKIMLA